MSDGDGREAAAVATRAPAQDGGRCGDADAAAEVEPISHNGPMACHIGHISPRPLTDGHLTVEVWANHVRIKRPCHVFPAKPSLRGKVKGMSARSGRRLRWAIENTPELTTTKSLFICLTYPAEWERQGRKVKRHLDSFGKRCRRVGAFFAWALEYQTRGAPHFHLLARFPEEWNLGKVREWVAQNWFEVVGSGDERHLRAGTSAEYVNNPDCAGWYISHYLGKDYQKTPPEGVTLPGRMWGMIGVKTPKPAVKHFEAGDRRGIQLVRLVRRSAASDFAFRQRRRLMSVSERKNEARFHRGHDPYLVEALLDFKNVEVYSEVRPENRKSWSPRDLGREKGFSVRNASKVAILFWQRFVGV